MRPKSDKTLLAALKNEDNASFNFLYQSFLPSIELYITRNFGNREDAEDIFQEAVIVLLKNVREDDFELTSSLKTYVFAIAKNLWMKRLRDSKRITVVDFEKLLQESKAFEYEIINEQSREEKLHHWIAKITENCQRILKAIFFYKEPMGSLMQKMGWKNKHTAANQQYKCIQQVKKEKEKVS